MATVAFMYRSTRTEANLNLRLRFKNETIGGKTRIFLTKEMWDSYLKPQKKKKKKTFDPEIMNEVKRLESEMRELELFILSAFHKEVNPSLINKNWLQLVINKYYNKDNSDFSIPRDLVSFIDYYVEQHPNLTVTQNKKYITILNTI